MHLNIEKSRIELEIEKNYKAEVREWYELGI